MEAKLAICLMFVFASNSLLEAATIRAPDLTRKNVRENCKLQWMVSGTFTDYTISLLLANGNSRSLGLNTYTEYDSVRGIITLSIWNVQWEDAGYYVLTLNTGSTPNPSSTATLFVYGSVDNSIVYPSGKTQFTEGDIIELNCSARWSWSMPQEFRRRIYYSWWFNSPWDGRILLQNISTGPAFTVTGDEMIGYSLRNDGQVLVVNTTQILYVSGLLYCRTQEEGSIQSVSSFASLNLLHRPFINDFSPPSKKYNLASPTGGSSYSFSFYVNSNPPLSSYSNWNFVDSSGNNKELPLNIGFSTSGNVLSSVPLSGPNPYGNYSATLYNAIGSTTVTFQVAKPGPPDAPSDFRVRYSSHSLVSLQWRCGWYNGDTQAVTVQLRNIAKNTDIQTLKTYLYFSDEYCYNSLFTSVFQVDPEVDYEGTIWSTNVYGQSSTSSLSLKTPSKPNFSVTCNDISVTDPSSAVVKVTTSAVNVWLNVSCCVEATGQCVLQSFTLLSTENQILLNQLPEGEEYVFGFVLFDVFFSQTYGLSAVKGIRRSRTSGCNRPTPDVIPTPITPIKDGEYKSLSTAVIVLTVLLGVAILLLFICLIVILRMTTSHPTTIPKSTQQRNIYA